MPREGTTKRVLVPLFRTDKVHSDVVKQLYDFHGVRCIAIVQTKLLCNGKLTGTGIVG